MIAAKEATHKLFVNCGHLLRFLGTCERFPRVCCVFDEFLLIVMGPIDEIHEFSQMTAVLICELERAVLAL